MLIDFRVQNYLSFKDSQTLSLIAGNNTDLPDNLMSPDNRRKPRLLKSAAVFGANASGKSNLISALYLMKTLVTETFKPGEPLPVTPFRLSQESRESPTEFEVTFAADGVVYQYGFSASPAQIFEDILSVPCFEYWFILHFCYTCSPFLPSGNKSAADNVVSELKKHLPDY